VMITHACSSLVIPHPSLKTLSVPSHFMLRCSSQECSAYKLGLLSRFCVPFPTAAAPPPPVCDCFYSHSHGITSRHSSLYQEILPVRIHIMKRIPYACLVIGNPFRTKTKTRVPQRSGSSRYAIHLCA
jgi:hypothetical protein